MPQGHKNPTESCVPGCEPMFLNATRSRWRKALFALLPGFLLSLAVSGQNAPGSDLPAQEAATDLETMLLAEGGTEHLPLRFARRVAQELDVIFHGERQLALAHFALQPLPFLQPPKPPSSAPVQISPTLYLLASAYRDGDRTVPLVDLTVDSTNYLFHELILAHLRLQVVESGDPYAELLRQRASALLPEISAGERLEAYLTGLAAFGGHTISVANQLERSARLHRHRGSNICRQVDRPYSLFASWERMFRSERYVARYYQPAAEGELVGRWINTKVALEPEDKRLFLRFIFDDFWHGELQRDLLERYCSDQAM